MAQKDVIFRHSWTNPDLLPCGNIHWRAPAPAHLLLDTATSIKALPSDVLFQVQREKHILLFQASVLFIWKLGEGWVLFSLNFLLFFTAYFGGQTANADIHRLIPCAAYCLPPAIFIPSPNSLHLHPFSLNGSDTPVTHCLVFFFSSIIYIASIIAAHTIWCFAQTSPGGVTSSWKRLSSYLNKGSTSSPQGAGNVWKSKPWRLKSHG